MWTPSMSLDTRPDTPTALDPPREGGRRRRRALGVVAVATVVAAVLVWSPWQNGPRDVRDGTTAVDEAELAARTGVDVNLVAVTAAGGLVELRVQVTDPDKADVALRDPDQR